VSPVRAGGEDGVAVPVELSMTREGRRRRVHTVPEEPVVDVDVDDDKAAAPASGVIRVGSAAKKPAAPAEPEPGEDALSRVCGAAMARRLVVPCLFRCRCSRCGCTCCRFFCVADLHTRQRRPS
jgi:hypothetical protein